MFTAIGRIVYTRRMPVVIAALVFLAISAVFGTSVFGYLKGGGFYAADAESTKARDALHEQLGQDAGTLIVLFTSKDGSKVDSPSYKQAVESTLANIKGQPGVGTTASFYTTGATQFVSNDRLSTYAVVGMTGDDEQQPKDLKKLRPLLTSNTLQVQLGGQAAVNEEINDQVSKDLQTSETLTFPILAVLLVVIFGSLVAASLPLAIGGVAILGAFLVLRVAANFTDVSVFAINVITMLGLGLAIDYSLFVISRFREELSRQNGDVQGALIKTLQTAGRTVMFSGLTVAISLLSLWIFPQMFLKSMGLGGAAAVLIAMLAALTVLPAILALLGERVNSLSAWSLLPKRWRPSTTAQQEGAAKEGFWYRTSRFVMRYPVAVLIATLIPLVVVGLPFLRVNLSIPDARSLPQGRESRIVSDALTDRFPHNETVPIQIVVHTQEAALQPASLSSLYSYTSQLGALRGVRRVDSLVNLDPRMNEVAYAAFYSDAGKARDPRANIAAQHYSHGNYSLVSVLYDSDPLSEASKSLVKDIRALSLPPGMTAQVGGESAYLVDFLSNLAASAPVAIGMIVSIVFVLLFLMLGSVVVPLKAVLLNILSLSVSFGSMVWVFQDGNLSNVLGFTPLGSVDGTQPILIFAIAFGLSMDYEVFLLSRVKEHYDRTKDTTASVAIGVQKTGAIITSAAMLLVIVIGGFATSEVVLIKEIGIGLALAVLVDATLVRMLLVPATMRLMGRFNWWAPRPLMRLYDRLGMSEVEREETASRPALKAEEAESMV